MRPASLPRELTLLKHLHELTTQDVPGELLPKEQRDAVFKAAGLDPAKTAAELKSRIARLSGGRRLESARVARQQAQAAHEANAAALARATPTEREANERALNRLLQLFPRLTKRDAGGFLMSCTAYPFAPLLYCVHKQAADLSRRAHKDVTRAFRISGDDMDRSMRNYRRNNPKATA